MALVELFVRSPRGFGIGFTRKVHMCKQFQALFIESGLHPARACSIKGPYNSETWMRSLSNHRAKRRTVLCAYSPGYVPRGPMQTN